MEHSTPAPHLVNGLHQLMKNVQREKAGESSGLSDVVCAETGLIGFGDGRVDYCGIPVEELCEENSFEAVAWLLLHKEAADVEQLADIIAVLADSAVIDQPIAETIATVPLQTRPLDLFPVCTALLSCFDPTPIDRTLEASRSQFWRLLAQVPVMLHVAFGGRLEEGSMVQGESSRSLSYAGKLLQILRDDNTVPTPQEERAMNSVMICQCLTEMRPACFAARFFGSTVTDVVAAVKAASSMFVAQLRNDPFAWTAARLREFQSPDHAEQWWNSRLPRVMPFGFSCDPEEPRTIYLRQECRQLLGSLDALIVESSATRLESILAQQGLFPTTDWVAARALTLLNVPDDRIALAIGISRMIGWAAQTIEQHHSAIPLLPRLRYAGSDGDGGK